MKNTARSLALLALCSAARGASVPAMSSFFGLGTYAISTSSNTPNDLSLFGHVGNVDNLSGVSVVVDGVNVGAIFFFFFFFFFYVFVCSQVRIVAHAPFSHPSTFRACATGSGRTLR
jgi:hypothetical protein